MFSLDKNVNFKKPKKVIVNIFQVKSKDVSCKEAKNCGTNCDFTNYYLINR